MKMSISANVCFIPYPFHPFSYQAERISAVFLKRHSEVAKFKEQKNLNISAFKQCTIQYDLFADGFNPVETSSSTEVIFPHENEINDQTLPSFTLKFNPPFQQPLLIPQTRQI